MVRRNQLFAFVAAAMVALTVGISPVSATYWGHSWNWTPGSSGFLRVNVADYTGSDPAISSQTSGAAYVWDNSPSVAGYQFSGSQVTLNVTQQLCCGNDGLTSIAGYGDGDCNSVCGQNGYTSATITFGRTNSQGGGMDYYPSNIVRGVETHELGHALGLGHPHNACSYSVMNHLVTQGMLSPGSYDMYNLNTLYPNTHYSPGNNPCPSN